MKMGKLEKSIVNSDRHGRKLIRWAESLLRHVPLIEEQSILDVGCGVGVLTRYTARTYNVQATGVDTDPEQIAEAERQSVGLTNVHHLVNDAVDLHFADNSFDVVVTFKTLHHIPNWTAAIREMLRVLKPGGYLVLFDLAAPQWMAGLHIGEFGVISTAELDRIVVDYNLRVVCAGRSGMFYKLVCQAAVSTAPD